MQLETARKIAMGFCDEIFEKGLVETALICGSIRRKKPEVNDADIVVVPQPNRDLSGYLKNFYKCERAGKKLVNLAYKGLDIDVYITDKENFEVVKLIRIGSAEHNTKLCGIALKKGWQLHADGRGLLDGDGNLISNTERGIVEKLLGKYVEPEERN